MSGRLHNFALALLAALTIAGAAPAQAQTITESQRLNFGEWGVTSNAGNYFVSITAGGATSHSPQLIELTPPQVGMYNVSGLPAFAAIASVTVLMTQTLAGPPGQTFTMDNFTTIAPNADGGGNTTITLGARAVTSGNMASYGEGLFTGELTLEINL